MEEINKRYLPCSNARIVRGVAHFVMMEAPGCVQRAPRLDNRRVQATSPYAVRSIRCEMFSRNYPPPEVCASFVRICLLMNILSGKDPAVQSAKLLGEDCEVNLFGA